MREPYSPLPEPHSDEFDLVHRTPNLTDIAQTVTVRQIGTS